MISYNFISPNDKNFGTKLLPRPIAVSNIYTAHNFNWKKKFYFSGESHKYHEAVFVLEGEVTVSEDDRIYHLQKGSLIVHAPYEFHRISTDSGARALIFSFESDELFPSGLYDGFFALPIEEEREFCALFDKIYTFYHESGEEDFKSDVSLEIACALPAFFLSFADSAPLFSPPFAEPASLGFTQSFSGFKVLIFFPLALVHEHVPFSHFPP